MKKAKNQETMLVKILDLQHENLAKSYKRAILKLPWKLREGKIFARSTTSTFHPRREVCKHHTLCTLLGFISVRKYLAAHNLQSG